LENTEEKDSLYKKLFEDDDDEDNTDSTQDSNDLQEKKEGL
jgi:hypothetical protein